MRSIAFKLLVAVCALHVSGAHWCALQALAWTGMIVSRSQTATVSEAVSTTFDGDHPCALCQVVEKGQQREQENQDARLVEVLAKLSFLQPAAVAVPAPTSAGFIYEDGGHARNSRAECPLLQPPRLA